MALQPLVLREVVLQAVQGETVEGADVRVEVPADLVVSAKMEFVEIVA